MSDLVKSATAAIRAGDAAELRRLLGRDPKLVNQSGPGMLKYAAEADRVEVLAVLVEAGADVNAPTFSDTPLTAAARRGSLAAVAWLLDHGADVNGRASPLDATPIHRAIDGNQMDVVKLLLDRGADPDLTYGNPARNAAAAARFWGRGEMAAYIESRGKAARTVEPEPVDVESPEFRRRDGSSPEAWFEAKWWHVYDYGTRRGLAALGEKNRVLFLVGYLVDQVADGGVAGFYANPSAEYAPQLPAALDALGATAAAAAVRDLNALFPNGAPAADDQTRWRQLEQLGKQLSKRGAALERLVDERAGKRGGSLLLKQLYDYYHAGWD